MQGIVGICSICGGEVVGHTGAWMAVVPPPPARCTKCGAVEQRGQVVRMRPATDSDNFKTITTDNVIVDTTKERDE